MCIGPDDNGNPTPEKTTFRLKDWEDIYICGEIDAESDIVLNDTWMLVCKAGAIAYNSDVNIFSPGYFYYSFQETFSETPRNKMSKPPVGKY